MSTSSQVKRVGVSGTGMIAHCFVRLVKQHYKDLQITRVLTRRQLTTLSDFPLD
ncbi:NAD(P)-dependent oxidoreductase, partial [Stutzerimonas nosocomialis]